MPQTFASGGARPNIAQKQKAGSVQNRPVVYHQQILLLLGYFFVNDSGKVGKTHSAEVAKPLLAHTYGVGLHLFLSYDEHIRYFVQLGIAYFSTYFFLAVVYLAANVLSFELSLYSAGIAHKLIRDRQHLHLSRHQPQRQLARAVL